MDEILIITNQSEVKNKIIILDCCHSGALGSSSITGNMPHIAEGVSILTARETMNLLLKWTRSIH